MPDPQPLADALVPSAVPARDGPDRYADAVRARRAELRAELGRDTHRAQLRTALALSRFTAAEALDVELARVGAVAREHATHPDRAVRRALPAALAAALLVAVGRAHARWAADLAPALRRIAGLRLGDLPPAWPALPGPPRPPPAGPPPAGVSLLAGALEGLVVWRLALLVLPLAGLPVLAGPALTPVAVGIAAAGVAVVVRSRRRAAEQACLLRHVETAVRDARTGTATELERALLRLEPALAAGLDTAVARRRAAADSELRALLGAERSVRSDHGC